MKPKHIPVREPNSFILRASARILFVALNLFAGYLTLKGHNAPGGGFIGGLVTALSLVLVSMVLGVDESRKLLRVDPLKLTLLGLCLAYGASAGPVLFGHPFLQHFVWEWDLPGFGHVHVLTAQIFDFGVYFVVVGVVSKMMLSFALSVQLRHPLEEHERSSYAGPLDEPIEDAAWEAQAPGAQGPPAPIRKSGHLDRRRWRSG
jgi:multisubunit Na+/H+ antiporter MnhB subunit